MGQSIDIVGPFECLAIPHASISNAAAYLLHGRNLKTRLNLAGFSAKLFVQDPQKEMKLFRNQVEEQLLNVTRSVYGHKKKCAGRKLSIWRLCKNTAARPSSKGSVAILGSKTGRQPERTRYYSAR